MTTVEPIRDPSLWPEVFPLLLRKQLSRVVFSPGSQSVETSSSRCFFFFFHFQIKLWNGWSQKVNNLLNSGLVSNWCQYCLAVLILQQQPLCKQIHFSLALHVKVKGFFFCLWLHSRNILLYSLCCCYVIPQCLCTGLHSQSKLVSCAARCNWWDNDDNGRQNNVNISLI